MGTAPMTRVLPTTDQAERIRRLFDAAAAEHPRRADLLRGIERSIIQEPDDAGPGLPEPVESLVHQVIAGVLALGPDQQQQMRQALGEG